LISGARVKFEVHLIERHSALILLWYSSLRQRRASMNALDESSRSSIVVVVIEKSKLPLLELEGLLIMVQKLLINAILVGITGVALEFS
jgi:hypothetical protein